MKKKFDRKKLIGVLAIVIAAIFFVSGALSLAGTIGFNMNMQYALKQSKVQNNGLTPDIDGLGYYAFTKNAQKNFRILQLTDTHIGGGFMSIGKDRKAMTAITKLVNYTKPDLIIITGDMVYPVPIQSGSANNRKTTQLLCALMDSFEIPWTVTFGNHDEEWYSLFGKEDICQVYESSKYCIFQRGPKNISGMGNTFINIKNPDQSMNTSLVLIDSNSYLTNTKLNVYDKIHKDQIDWYKQELYRIKEHYQLHDLPPSLAFFHIPLNEYEDAWKAYKNGDPDVIYHYGDALENVYPPAVRGEFFDAILELGSTKGVFCGHDHVNGFSVTYKGVRLTYGKSIDYLAYFGTYKGFPKMTAQRGGTVIEIDNQSNFTVEPVKLDDIM
ncbi:MAG: metallophosphoesterase [Christensenellales bacterium]|jgi:3',5'-cyclic AMP phosphodiesterase CpdA|nr:hypothetical protein [Clostridiales bacterium]